MVKTYQQRKAEAREQAIEWQYDFEKYNYGWADFVAWSNYFKALGKRYGLLKEFRENGICF